MSEDAIKRLGQRLFKDLKEHNLIKPFYADWVKSPEGIAEFIETYWIKTAKTRARCGHIEFERRGKRCIFRVVVSERRLSVNRS